MLGRKKLLILFVSVFLGCGDSPSSDISNPKQNSPHPPVEYRVDPRGLANLGNTCFINAAYKLFFSIEEIHELLDRPSDRFKWVAPEVRTAFRDLMVEIERKNESGMVSELGALDQAMTASIAGFRDDFPAGQQGDSQEFMIKLLEKSGLEEQLNGIFRYRDSDGCAGSIFDWIARLWNGVPELGPVPGDHGQVYHPIRVNNPNVSSLNPWSENTVFDRSENVHLSQLAAGQFFSDAHSPGSGARWRPLIEPDFGTSVLILGLSRFVTESPGVGKDGKALPAEKRKSHSFVHVDEKLEFDAYVDPELNHIQRVSYDLKGVVMHLGDIGGGHYMTYLRKRSTDGSEFGAWELHNDSQVKVLTSEQWAVAKEQLGENGYLFLYELNTN